MNSKQPWKSEFHPEEFKGILLQKHPRIIIIIPPLPYCRDVCFHSRVMSILSQEPRRVDVLAAPCELNLLTPRVFSWDAALACAGNPRPSHIVLWELGCEEPMQDTAPMFSLSSVVCVSGPGILYPFVTVSDLTINYPNFPKVDRVKRSERHKAYSGTTPLPRN